MNIKLQAPAGLTSVNWNGARYEVINGVVTVPEAAYDELTRPIHGFTRYVEGPRGAPASPVFVGQNVAPHEREKCRPRFVKSGA